MIEMKPELSRYEDEAIWIACVDWEDIQGQAIGPAKLPSRDDTRMSPANFIAYLSSLPEGFGAIYPLFRELTLAAHRQRLRVAATKLGIRIEIHKHSDLTFLVEKLDTEKRSRPIPQALTPVELGKWKFANTKKEAILPADNLRDYRSYVNKLMNELEYRPKSGVLVPITNKGVFYTQTRLHHEATLRRVKIKTSRWDGENLLMQFAGYKYSN